MKSRSSKIYALMQAYKELMDDKRTGRTKSSGTPMAAAAGGKSAMIEKEK